MCDKTTLLYPAGCKVAGFPGSLQFVVVGVCCGLDVLCIASGNNFIASVCTAIHLAWQERQPQAVANTEP